MHFFLYLIRTSAIMIMAILVSVYWIACSSCPLYQFQPSIPSDFAQHPTWICWFSHFRYLFPTTLQCTMSNFNMRTYQNQFYTIPTYIVNTIYCLWRFSVGFICSQSLFEWWELHFTCLMARFISLLLFLICSFC